MKPVSKEEFSVILERQQESGLSIKDLFSNESYTISNFHYWKNKFGSTWANNTQLAKRFEVHPQMISNWER